VANMSRGWKKSPMSSIRLRPVDPDGIAARLPEQHRPMTLSGDL